MSTPTPTHPDDAALAAVLTPDASPDASAVAARAYIPPSPAAVRAMLTGLGYVPNVRSHDRAGITKNKSQGTPKAKRQQAKRSRRINRGKV